MPFDPIRDVQSTVDMVEQLRRARIGPSRLYGFQGQIGSARRQQQRTPGAQARP